eukprot:CAMPEP_0196584250 /NCGR_PEP_ID=MMETSP1081-20130531/46361_1 /TAXON_ID=36882 /ORGANISM="Pyramimonas amylifera, Strain CCMP720" /LENGTH=79 /DNA_ID=CAMNT_0041905389 /DNA_START=176 /DNA_END=415 /DNA_ORIENTATION=+
MKVKDVPDFVKKTVTKENATVAYNNWFANYKKTYMDTNSPMPVVHVIGSVFCLSYVIAWPTEYSHWKHEQEAKIQGGKH